MTSKIALVCALLLVAVAASSAQFYGGFGHGFGGHGGFYGAGHYGSHGYGGHGFGHHGGYHYPRYNFAYGVSDAHTGDHKQQSEFRDGGFTSSQYSQNIVHG